MTTSKYPQVNFHCVFRTYTIAGMEVENNDPYSCGSDAVVAELEVYAANIPGKQDRTKETKQATWTDISRFFIAVFEYKFQCSSSPSFPIRKRTFLLYADDVSVSINLVTVQKKNPPHK